VLNGMLVIVNIIYMKKYRCWFERIEMIIPHARISKLQGRESGRKGTEIGREKHTFLGLLAKIKCSICSYQFNI
jgi:hypothetical protein